jgi:GNAT superfamily N-acetyltransferase
MADANPSNLWSLAELLSPGERVYLVGAQPTATNILDVGPPLNCFQMLFPSNAGKDTTAASSDIPIACMKLEDAPDMVALTDLAFPGFFRARTYEMGTYYGIRINNELVAMAGERLAVPGFREISAVVTHPEHVGKGYATLLMNRLLNDHTAVGLKSFSSRQGAELPCHSDLPTLKRQAKTPGQFAPRISSSEPRCGSREFLVSRFKPVLDQVSPRRCRIDPGKRSCQKSCCTR